MVTKTLSRTEKFDFSEKKLNLGYKLKEIAKMSEIDMSLNSLYVLRSDIKKTKSQVKPVVDCRRVVNHISLSNLKESLKNSEHEDAEYILKLLTMKKKPLQSNALKLIDLIRDMLLEEFN